MFSWSNFELVSISVIESIECFFNDNMNESWRNKRNQGPLLAIILNYLPALIHHTSHLRHFQAYLTSFYSDTTCNFNNSEFVIWLAKLSMFLVITKYTVYICRMSYIILQNLAIIVVVNQVALLTFERLFLLLLITQVKA